MRFLIVDDNPNDLLLVTYVIESDPKLAKAHHLEPAETLTAAIAKVKQAAANDEPFDAILLDLNLPDSHDGQETFSRMHAAAAPTPIVIYSGNHDDELLDDLLEQGASDYIIKTIGLSGVAVFRTLRKAAKHARHPGGTHTAGLVEGVRQMRSAVTTAMSGDPGGAPYRSLMPRDGNDIARDLVRRMERLEDELSRGQEADDTLRNRVVSVEMAVASFGDLPAKEKARVRLRHGGVAGIVGVMLPIIVELLARYLGN